MAAVDELHAGRGVGAPIGSSAVSAALNFRPARPRSATRVTPSEGGHPPRFGASGSERQRWEGANREGPSDKTVAVLTFERLDGTPIAVYYNYAVHAVITGQLDQVSGDIPGAASRYIEDSFDDNVVALWSSGAAGDQT